MSEKKLKFNSKTIHGGQKPDKAYGAVMPPIYQTSTYAQSTRVGIWVLSIPEVATRPERHWKVLLQASKAASMVSHLQVDLQPWTRLLNCLTLEMKLFRSMIFMGEAIDFLDKYSKNMASLFIS